MDVKRDKLRLCSRKEKRKRERKRKEVWMCVLKWKERNSEKI